VGGSDLTRVSAAVIAAYHDLWHVEQWFRMTKSVLRARPCSTTNARPSRPT
jgi:hypothetical protein